MTESTVLTHRPRLESRLRREALSRLTVITGGAGSGKTTLLKQSLDARSTVWHTITRADSTFSALARQIVRKLRLVVPSLSHELIAAVEGGRGPLIGSESNRPMAIAAALAEDLDAHLERVVVLVLDDVHELGDEESSADFLSAICRHAPARLRVVTSSRRPLPFPVARLHVSGDLDELSSEELAFTVDEIADLLGLRLGRRDTALASEIRGITGGWPVAVSLAIEISGGDLEALQSMTDRGPLFEYLAEEVIGSDAGLTTPTLRDIALLPWVSEDLAGHLELATDLGQLSANSVIVGTAPDVPGALIMSPLIREFLLDHPPEDREAEKRLLIAAADWYASREHSSEALHCLRDAADAGATVRFLATHGESMISKGASRLLVDTIATVPDADRTDDLRLLDAEARQLLGDWEGAELEYRLLVPDQGEIPADVAWRLGFLEHMRGNVEEALATYRRGERGSGDDASEAALLAWQASAHWLRGERGEAKSLADRALELARDAGDPRPLATAHTVLAMIAALDGDRATNDLHYLKALEYADVARDVVQTIRIRTNRASAFLEEGEFDSALAELEIALRLADMTGFELWRAMSLSNRGQVHTFRGRLEEAIADLTEARHAFRRIGSRLESYPLANLGDVYRIRGDTARARASYEEAISMAESQQDLQALVPAMSGLARLVAPEDSDLALGLAERATEVDSVIGRVQALVAAGWASHHAGRSHDAHALAVEAARVAGIRRDLPGLAEALELRAATEPARARDHLSEARDVWIALGAPIAVARTDLGLAKLTGGAEGSVIARAAAEDLHRHGARGLAQDALTSAHEMTEGPPPELAIKTLGGFDVVVRGESTPLSAWQSRVAREVLWMLIAARGRSLNREVLLDRLWPTDDPSKSSNRLSVALSTIRKVLDPAGGHPNDHYLASDRHVVRLMENHISIDVNDFLEDARRGSELLARGREQRALAHFAAAEERYVGEFLEEDPYADWAISLREEARSVYLTVAAALAAAADRAGDHNRAARLFLRMLERDAYNEPAHLGLVATMRRSGRHGTARRLYGNYVSRMSELGVEPEPFPDTPDSVSES